MAKYNGSGWHFQHTRHSNARKYGHAGGKYLSNLNKKYPHLLFNEKGDIKGIEATKNLSDEEINLYLQQNKTELHKTLHAVIDKLETKVKNPQDQEKLKKLKEEIKQVDTQHKLKEWLKVIKPMAISGTAGAIGFSALSLVGGVATGGVALLLELALASIGFAVGTGLYTSVKIGKEAFK